MSGPTCGFRVCLAGTSLPTRVPSEPRLHRRLESTLNQDLSGSKDRVPPNTTRTPVPLDFCREDLCFLENVPRKHQFPPGSPHPRTRVTGGSQEAPRSPAALLGSHLPSWPSPASPGSSQSQLSPDSPRPSGGRPPTPHLPVLAKVALIGAPACQGRGWQGALFLTWFPLAFAVENHDHESGFHNPL